MSIFQCLRALVAEPNWPENHLFLANVTMPKRAEVGVAQAQCLDARDTSDLQNDEPLAAQGMKRMGDFSRSQRLIGSLCSSPGAWPHWRIKSSRRRWWRF